METTGDHILIEGTGAAVMALAKLLGARANTTIWLDEPEPMQGAGLILLLNSATLALLDEVFSLRASVEQSAHAIFRQLTPWGRPRETEDAAPALAIEAASLHRLMWEATVGPALRVNRRPGMNCTWEIEARDAGTAPRDDLLKAGQRVGLQCSVKLLSCPNYVSTLEDLAGGWLRLLPLGGERAVLQAVVPNIWDTAPHTTLRSLLSRSRHIAPLVDRLTGPARQFPVAPTFHSEPARRRDLFVGNAALKQDPLCGNETEQSLHSGILAAATITAAGELPDERDGLLDHYRMRLTKAFRTHLEACVDFYGSSRHPNIWQHEASAMQTALKAVDHTDRLEPPPPFRLNGFRLERSG